MLDKMKDDIKVLDSSKNIKKQGERTNFVKLNMMKNTT